MPVPLFCILFVTWITICPNQKRCRMSRQIRPLLPGHGGSGSISEIRGTLPTVSPQFASMVGPGMDPFTFRQCLAPQCTSLSGYHSHTTRIYHWQCCQYIQIQRLTRWTLLPEAPQEILQRKCSKGVSSAS
ncbi:hypothetical protein MPH_07269 [Macrophomina phaseolina MS6]|uniref:Secreted protein n=1 Tax=Macrophomina phaseolina (strain MS6) TaxID=1126212 RepID=K2RZB3_MACPH|nr:hypothetical protein MPH_07269 [Macrophomina phaseolina MS6]